jgi:hypothetical protein
MPGSRAASMQAEMAAKMKKDMQVSTMKKMPEMKMVLKKKKDEKD